MVVEGRGSLLINGCLIIQLQTNFLQRRRRLSSGVFFLCFLFFFDALKLCRPFGLQLACRSGQVDKPKLFELDNYMFNHGNGKQIAFWNNHWISEYLLKSSFPTLYHLSKNQSVSIVDFLGPEIRRNFSSPHFLVEGGIAGAQKSPLHSKLA